MELKNIEQLLSQVKTISDSYARLDEASGGKFNIFSILRMESDEVRTHSRFISELLNPNGVHGLNDEFLKLFIETLRIETQLDTDTAWVEQEHKRIDIFISDSKGNVIMIENKVYAGEQTDQLERYHKKYPKGKLLFLTLDGIDSEQESAEGIYEPISYRDDIIKWLKECKKIAVDKPTLRETLTQYINLIKKLTNQNIHTKMNEELMKLFGGSEENFNTLMKIRSIDMRWFAMQKTVNPALKELKEKFEGEDLTVEINTDLNHLSKMRYDTHLLEVHSKNLKEKNLRIRFDFQQYNTNHLIGGFAHIGLEKKSEYDYTKIQEEFKNRFEGLPVRNSDWWPAYFRYHGFWNWGANLYDVRNLIFGNFKDDLESKIKTMLEIVENAS